MNRKRTAAWLTCAVALTGTMASVRADEEADRALLARAQALFKPLPADASTPERPLTPERAALAGEVPPQFASVPSLPPAGYKN